MKNLNFLSNQSDFGLENGSGLTREWLGIDSTVSRKLFTLLFVLFLGFSQMWGATVTYTTSSGSPVASGNTIANSSASFSDVTNNSNHTQMLANGNMELTLTSLGGINISNIRLSMKSNSSKGAGKLKYSTDGGSTYTYLVGGASSASNFNTSNWYGSWSTSYVNVDKSVSINNVTQLKIKIEATVNSLYCQSFTLTYEAGGGCDKEVTFAQSVTNGSATFNPVGPVATCSATASDRQVSVSITPTTGYALTSGPTVSGVTNATISGSGPYTIQLPQNGNGELTLSATCTAIAVTEVSLNKNSTSIVEGSTETLTATITPSNALDKVVTWSSDATGVATVNNSGVVTAVAPGNATITVTTHDGSHTATCTVTVTALPKDHFIDEVQGTVVADKTSAYNISSVTIADKSVATSGSCEQQHYHFVGWITKAKYDAGTPISDGDIQTGNKTPNNSTYYAVWAKQGAGGGTNTISADLNTLKNAVSSISSGYSSKTFEMSDGVNSYTFTADVTKNTQNATKNWMQVGKNSDSRRITITDELPGNITNISSSSIYNGSQSAYSGTVYYNTTTSTTNPIASVQLSSASSFSLDVTNGETGGYIMLSTAMCLGDLSVTYSTVSYTDYIAKCCTPLVSINGSFNRYHLKIFHHIIMSMFVSLIFMC